jgi:hypothetical protein
MQRGSSPQQQSKRHTKQQRRHTCPRCGRTCARLVWAYTSETEVSRTKTQVCGKCKKELDDAQASREAAVRLRCDAVGAQRDRDRARRTRQALLHGRW